MSPLQRVLITAAFTLLAFLAWQQSAGAVDMHVSAPPVSGVTEGMEVTLTVTVNVPEYPEGSASGLVSSFSELVVDGTVDIQDGVGTAQLTGTFDADGYESCASSGFVSPSFSVSVLAGIEGPFVGFSYTTISCSAEIYTTFIDDLVQNDVCGPDNDEIVGLANAPYGTGVDAGTWQGNSRTVTLYPTTNTFSPDTKTSRLFTDVATPCVTVISPTLNQPAVTPVCGPANDLVSPAASQPEGVNPMPLDSRWVGNSRTFTYSTLPGYVFADGYNPEIAITDANLPCPAPVLTLNAANDVLADVQVGDTVILTATLTLWEHHPYTVWQSQLSLDDSTVPGVVSSSTDSTITITYTVPVDDALVAACVDGSVVADTAVDLEQLGNTFRVESTSVSLPCDTEPVIITISPVLHQPTVVEVCGSNNDIVTPAGSQPEGVIVQPDISQYSEAGVILLTYSALEGYAFADGYNNVIEHTDQGDNCPILTVDITDTTFQNLPTEGTRSITGSLVLDNVDLNNATNQQLMLDGTEVTFFSRLRDGSTWRYEWRAANSDLRAMCTDGEFLVESTVDVEMYGVTETYAIDPFTVPCSLAIEESTITISPDVENPFVDIRLGETVVPVTVTFNVHIEDGQTVSSLNVGVFLEQYYLFAHVDDFQTSNPTGTRTYSIDVLMRGPALANICSDNSVLLSARGTVYYSNVTNYDFTYSTFTEYPCSLLYPVIPDLDAVEQARVCGDDNDTFSTTQENVVLSPGEWVDNESTITFTPAEGYYIPADASSTMPATDDGPCVVTPNLPYVEQVVCGPDNDIIIIPDQEESVIIQDSGWVDGERNITWTPDIGYIFPESTPDGMIARDMNTSCDPEPDHMHLTIVLKTSDGGSLEGTGYQVYTATAAQVAPMPYTEGVVDATNRIVLEDLLPGEYRLVLAADGYEPLDEIFIVTDGAEEQEIEVNVAALQVPVTPTPEPTVAPSPTVEPTTEPTVEPTTEPTIEPTTEPTVEPTAEPTIEPTTEPTVEPTATVAPTTPPTAETTATAEAADPTVTATSEVTGLPETGSGSAGGSMTVLGILAAAMIMGMILASRRKQA